MKKSGLFVVVVILSLSSLSARADGPQCRVLSDPRYMSALSSSDLRFQELQQAVSEASLPAWADAVKNEKSHLFVRDLVNETFGPTIHELTGHPKGENVQTGTYRLRHLALDLQAQLRRPENRELPVKAALLSKIQAFFSASHPLVLHFDCVYYQSAAGKRELAAKAARAQQAIEAHYNTGEAGGYCGDAPQPGADEVCSVAPVQAAVAESVDRGSQPLQADDSCTDRSRSSNAN